MSGERRMDESEAINWCRRGEMAKPCSASLMAGSNSFAQGRRPCFLMGQFKRAQYAWRPHRATTNLRLGERHRCAVGLQEKLLGGAGRCGFSAVISAHVLAVPQHDQRTTADAGGLRLDQRQYRLHRNRGIDGRTALTQHFPPGFGRQRIGGCCHVFRGVPGLQVGAITRGDFRRDGQRREGGALQAARANALAISESADRR